MLFSLWNFLNMVLMFVDYPITKKLLYHVEIQMRTMVWNLESKIVAINNIKQVSVGLHPLWVSNKVLSVIYCLIICFFSIFVSPFNFLHFSFPIFLSIALILFVLFPLFLIIPRTNDHSWGRGRLCMKTTLPISMVRVVKFHSVSSKIQ